MSTITRSPWLRLPSGEYIHMRHVIAVEFASDVSQFVCVVRWLTVEHDAYNMIHPAETLYRDTDAHAIRAWLEAAVPA